MSIESITATIPCAGLSYTDLRPTITASSIDEYREQLIEVGKLAGNDAFVKRMSTQLDAQTGLTEPLTSSGEVLGDGVLFNKEDHTYSKNGLPYLSGSTFAHMFEKEFPKDTIAAKVADGTEKTPEEVIAAWEAKGQLSLDYGTLIHKCIETYLKHGETPSNQYLKDIVDDWAYTFADTTAWTIHPEYFLQDDAHQLCGVADAVAFDEKLNVVLYDWKTGDIHKKQQNTLGKDFPNDALSLYTLQLNFYRYILEQKGNKVTKMVIGWLNGEHWEKVDIPKIDIKPYLEQVWKPKKLSSN